MLVLDGHLMQKVELNWKRSKIICYILYGLCLAISVLMGLDPAGRAISAASFILFSILFHYMLSRVNYAQKQKLSIPMQPTTQDMLSLYKELSGGWLKVLSYLFGGVIGSIFTLVLFSAF